MNVNVKVENVEKNVVNFEIEVDAATFSEGMNKSFKKNAGKFNVPGFRKGKAPQKIVERYYGAQALYEDAVNAVFPAAFSEAAKEKGIEPVDYPKIDIKQIGEGRNLIFTAKVVVKPEIELGMYKGVEVGKVVYTVSEEDVEKETVKAAEKNSRLIPVTDRPIQIGDITVIDYEGSVDGASFEGGKGSNHSLTIGSGSFIKGFEEQLIGLSAESSTEVNVTFPDDYHSEELSGKDAFFKVDIKEIKFKEIPVVDDEFAREVSEFETLEEYKADTRKKLQENAEDRTRHELEDKVISKVVSNAVVEIPHVMIEKQIDRYLSDMENRFKYQGYDLKQYFQTMGMTEAEFRKRYEQKAEEEVKTRLVIEKVSATEGVIVSDSDFDEEVRRVSENYKQTSEDFKKHLQEDDIEYIKKSIIMTKTVNLLVNNAVAVDMPEVADIESKED